MREAVLIIHFIGLAMGLGVSFANLFLGIAASKMPPEEAKAFLMKTLVLTKMGHTGLTLLIISGLYLMSPYWYMLSATPLLIAKLALVAFLVILVIVMTRIGKKVKTGDFSQAKIMKPLGRIGLITTLLIVILAVAVFH